MTIGDYQNLNETNDLITKQFQTNRINAEVVKESFYQMLDEVNDRLKVKREKDITRAYGHLTKANVISDYLLTNNIVDVTLLKSAKDAFEYSIKRISSYDNNNKHVQKFNENNGIKLKNKVKKNISILEGVIDEYNMKKNHTIN